MNEMNISKIHLTMRDFADFVSLECELCHHIIYQIEKSVAKQSLIDSNKILLEAVLMHSHNQ